MKRIILIGVILVAVCGVVWASYFVGRQRGYHEALILQDGTFVVSLDALDKIRAGDVSAGIETVEKMLFICKYHLWRSCVSA
jgi:hypothetical protein